MLAKRGGVPLETAYEVIRASSGNSFVHETESQVILNGSYDIGFTLDLALKDLGFALAMGREFEVPLELAGLVRGDVRARARAVRRRGAVEPGGEAARGCARGRPAGARLPGAARRNVAGARDVGPVDDAPPRNRAGGHGLRYPRGWRAARAERPPAGPSHGPAPRRGRQAAVYVRRRHRRRDASRGGRQHAGRDRRLERRGGRGRRARNPGHQQASLDRAARWRQRRRRSATAGTWPSPPGERESGSPGS